jgi:hypothetical protein
VTAVAEQTIGGRFPTPGQLAADAASFARLQYEATAVMVEAFAVAVVFGPDEPAQYYPTARGEAVPCPP